VNSSCVTFPATALIMAFLLAPYNDGMRLGMGFNSYTQTPCINGAVTIATKAKDQIQNSTSQTVSYSSRFVEKLSDVLGAMNISSAASIKSGTVEVSGNSSSINEDKIKASDLNAVVTVRVRTTWLWKSETSTNHLGRQPNNCHRGEQYFRSDRGWKGWKTYGSPSGLTRVQHHLRGLLYLR
jgi:hypothetical protein